MKYLKQYLCATTLLCSLPAVANEWSWMIETEHAQQRFADADADINSLRLLPAWDHGPWSISTTLAWQRVSGAYYFNTRNPSLAAECSRLLESGGQALPGISLPQLTPRQAQFCSEDAGVESETLEESVQGLTDVEVFVNYFWPPLSQRFSVATGVGYKHDNGDIEKGLGTGTRNVFAETNGVLDLAPFSLVLTAGYEHVARNDTPLELDDYAYGAVDLGWQALDSLTLGTRYRYLQANLAPLDDVDFVTWYGQWRHGGGWGVRVYVSDYLSGSGSPDSEWGGSLSYAF